MATPNYAIDEMSAGQQNAYLDFNRFLQVFETLLSGCVSRTNSGPPGGPSFGDVYIVDSLTGLWSTYTLNDIAYYDNGAWQVVTPVDGTRIYVQDEDVNLIYDGSAWRVREGAGGVYTHTVATDADVTVTEDQAGNAVIAIDDSASPAVFTAAHFIFLPNISRQWSVVNNTAVALTFKTAGGFGSVAVAAGMSALLYCDGNDFVIRLTADV